MPLDPDRFGMDDLRRALEAEGYICDGELVTTVYLAVRLGKPLLVTGAPGVGKTELAKALSRVFDTELIRLQCYEGLDETKALYEWNYQKQLLRLQLAKERNEDLEEADLFGPEYLLERPLLRAIRSPRRAVLLIDEVDKTDEEFEAFLLEVLADFQVSIPELGTVAAATVPVVVLTSNAERELSDALKRRCLFLYLDYPDFEKEARIIQARVPDIPERLARQVAAAVQNLRAELELKKKPAVAETLDWARALLLLGEGRLTPELIGQSLNVLLKDMEDQELFHRALGCSALCRRALQVG